MFKLIFADPDVAVADALGKEFSDAPVWVVNDYFQHVDVENAAVVNAANSFGIMGAGVAGAIRDYFGEQLQDRVIERINRIWLGDMPVGTSEIYRGWEVGAKEDDPYQFVLYSPTMRAPGTDLRGTQNAYLAMFATLREAFLASEFTNKPETVVCSGLGTAIGRMEPEDAASQMRKAYDDFMHKVGEK